MLLDSGHLSNYYPDTPDITDQEIKLIQSICDQNHLSTLNTRYEGGPLGAQVHVYLAHPHPHLAPVSKYLLPARKYSPTSTKYLEPALTSLVKHSSTEFTLSGASTNETLSPELFPKSPLISKDNVDKEINIHLKGADFGDHLSKVCTALKCIPSENKNRKRMIEEYIKSSETGDINAHKSGTIAWVKDDQHSIESYLGFIENYVDPYAQRSEWEGFTAIINKELSIKFKELVNNAEHLMQSLPWDSSFEVNVFRRPVFSALEILNFATAGPKNPWTGVSKQFLDMAVRQEFGQACLSSWQAGSSAWTAKSNILSDSHFPELLGHVGPACPINKSTRCLL
ncbi:hypothetical protein PSTG_00587 [Puccinia striiformis f. sp. tritici PST-78]|uniref:Uncharacterized protein n=1 Tax=Puccinia striiformis f. sp. tritici PST-78 TaxID=1165861 RepID=A0A0L0W486_9BASI|nr:hypothetical protein PSTG_00587 [Puccinia striiformis f. sp. tritici PST-78]